MSRSLPLFLAGLGLATALPAANPPVRTISADVSAVKGPFTAMGTECVGAGRANEGLRADWQRQLSEVHAECGFKYIRFHGLLTDDMGVYLYDNRAKKWVYNWQYVDALMDAILGTGMRPFVELGFMPQGMASGPSTIFWWKGNVTPPKDPELWRNLIHSLVAHWTERYGDNEVAKWYFEVWNEPNLSGFWIGDKKGMDDKAFGAFAQQEYFKLYKVTAEAVKSVDNRYRVGGPATAGNAWLPEMIGFCHDNKVPLDFITTHHYGVNRGFLDENGTTGTVLSSDPQEIIRQVKGSREQIQASAMPGLPLHYTEWSTSYTPSDPVHDSYISPAFILNKIKGVGDAAQSMSYWTFTDIFEEAGPRATPFHGGFGLINYEDIRKPAFYAFRWMHKLGGTELVNDDPDSWVCRDKRGAVQVLAWDFTINVPPPKVNDQDYYNQDLPAHDVAPLHVHLTHLKPGLYTLRLYRVGYRANDAYTAYLDMGAPRQLTQAQVAALRQQSNGAPYRMEQVQVGEEGTFDREIPLRENDVVLLTLVP